ncbi:nickel pincer cofactor biosynthesis protein LarB [Clostridium massiliamazoniense]|uniref:nickel pincer cofactor biosynthesis protein LarB n=1 Tax=Clostridium massiliamazoniense TaxID=1347366 RepID=UPI0006D84D0F|nr:nickel pincer cofactor biosynthesis protein LarB [Clostridium massiliamazoniense]
MDKKSLEELMKKVKSDEIKIEDAVEKISALDITELGFANIDNHRALRVGYPEVIYCEGKTNEHAIEIIKAMLSRCDSNILGTRANKDIYDEIVKIEPRTKYNETSRTLWIKRDDEKITESYIAVVTAGTSDIPVAEEAAITCEVFGNKVERVYDVGVAGIHRLFNRLDVIRGAKVVIVIAGMEGALASVVGGLIDKPLIAVPTSVGYGTNFNGLTALLTMLNSCASGITVVNIDNGFGAGYSASMINKL